MKSFELQTMETSVELVLTEDFVQLAADSIERDRPELLSAFTSALRAEIGPPWNTNDPSPEAVCQFDKSEIHYAVVVSGAKTAVGADGITFIGNAQAKFRKKSGATNTDQAFSSPVSCTVWFKDLSKTGDYYRLAYGALELETLPPSVREVVSWYVTSNLNDHTPDNSGIPKSMKLDKGIATLTFKPPTISGRKVVLNGVVS